MDKPNPLYLPLTHLNGITSRTSKLFEKLGIHQIQDLLFHLPNRYQDRTKVQAIARLSAGTTALISGTIQFLDVLPRGRKSLMCRISDETGFIDLRFFHFTAHQYAMFKPGIRLSCFGEVRHGYAGLEMTHPEYQIISNEEMEIAQTNLTAVYPLTEGLSQNQIRKAVKQAVAICEADSTILKNWLPDYLIKDFNFPTLLSAIKKLHFPEPSQDLNGLQDGSSSALKRLVFEELLTHHLSLKLAKQKARIWQGPDFSTAVSMTEAFINSLPFKLTDAQLRVIAEITADCKRTHPMLRLVQGDVGSGKTIVAAYTAMLALSAGYQVAIMAPTELLAEQHYRNFNDWFKNFDINIVLLTSQVKGNSRKTLLSDLAGGSANIAIGTHALFQEEVNFQRLGLVIIDEQHRFGVQQRLALRAKGQLGGVRPHQLVMTATPIPRTLAMLQYSDLDISIIDQLPPGRKPITTSVIPSERRNDVINRINSWVENKKQAYWVCTLIEESEIMQCEAAENTAGYLVQALPHVRIALLHGRLKASDKETIMLAFKNHEIDLLVATTVIEVGVDVPNASLMIIENPERLGLSQLHQLRGRVGRGVDDSYCLLMYQSPLSQLARQRLGILRDSQDGFLIAEKDLQLRGPGEVMGTRQTGQINFKIADLVRDVELLDNIPPIADALITDSPESVVPLIKRWIGYRSDYSEV